MKFNETQYDLDNNEHAQIHRNKSDLETKIKLKLKRSMVVPIHDQILESLIALKKLLG